MKKNVGIDIAANEMVQRAEDLGMETVWDRFEKQEPQCGFGLLGICCRNCIQGPCRINPFGDPKSGVCGADADTIVARNLLRSIAGGTASHVDHAYEAVKTLHSIAQGETDYEIKDEAKLRSVAKKLGIESNQKDAKTLAGEVAEAALQDFSNHSDKEMKWLLSTAPQERIETWRKLGIMPRNPDREIREAMHQTAMGMDSDPVNMLLAAVKLALVDGYAGRHLATDIQDIIFGVPNPVQAEVNLGVIDKDKVNIVVHGHVPLLSEKIVEWAQKLDKETKEAGAAGIQVSGVCCTGNEVLMRQGVAVATNFLAQELVIATGAVDLMVVDVQCIMPSLATAANCFHTRLVTTMPIVKIPGAEHVPFNHHSADADAEKIVRMAIESYQKRDNSGVHIPDIKAEMWAGFSVEAVVNALKAVDNTDPLKPLADNIKNGNILGAVGTVGCNNVKMPFDNMHVEMMKDLIGANVLVVATGCSAHALSKAGLLTPEATEKYAGDGLKAVLTAIGQAAGLNAPLPPILHMGSCVDNSRIGDLLHALSDYIGVPIKDLPVAATAPEPQHEKALSIGTWAVALGLLTHLGVPPHVLGSSVVAGALTGDPVESLLGGKFVVESDPHRASQLLIDHLKSQRKKLGI